MKINCTAFIQRHRSIFYIQCAPMDFYKSKQTCLSNKIILVYVKFEILFQRPTNISYIGNITQQGISQAFFKWLHLLNKAPCLKRMIEKLYKI